MSRGFFKFSNDSFEVANDMMVALAAKKMEDDSASFGLYQFPLLMVVHISSISRVVRIQPRRSHASSVPFSKSRLRSTWSSSGCTRHTPDGLNEDWLVMASRWESMP